MVRGFMMTAVVAVICASLGCERQPSGNDDAAIPTPTESIMTASTTQPDSDAGLLRFTMNDIREQPLHLSTFAGKVVLFVNVASKCGYTPQYTGLQSLYEKYADQGLVIVGVPANNFGGQEPGTNAEVLEFCTINYAVTFPILAKVSVKGDDTCDLYRALIAASEPTGETGDVQWNFEKFLVGRDGDLVGRFRSKVKPDDPRLIEAIEAALKAG